MVEATYGAMSAAGLTDMIDFKPIRFAQTLIFWM